MENLCKRYLQEDFANVEKMLKILYERIDIEDSPDAKELKANK